MDNISKFVKETVANLEAYNSMMAEKGIPAHNPWTHAFGLARPGDSEFAEGGIVDTETALNLLSVCEVTMRPGEGGMIWEMRAPSPVGTAVETTLRPGEPVLVLESHGGIGFFGKVDVKKEENTPWWTLFFSEEWIRKDLLYVLASAYPGKGGMVPNKKGLELGMKLTYEEAIERHLRVKPLPESVQIVSAQ